MHKKSPLLQDTMSCLALKSILDRRSSVDSLERLRQNPCWVFDTHSLCSRKLESWRQTIFSCVYVFVRKCMSVCVCMTCMCVYMFVCVRCMCVGNCAWVCVCECMCGMWGVSVVCACVCEAINANSCSVSLWVNVY